MNISKRFATVLGLCFALTIAVSAVGATVLPPGDQDFVLINRTGYEISEVYLSPVKTKSWGDDVMGPDDTLKNGTKVTIEFEHEATACKWDMKIVFSDEEEAIWEGFDLCKISEITLKYEGKRPTATYK
jgi:hypothetical protein